MSKIWLTLRLKDGRSGGCGQPLNRDDVELLETHPMTPRTAERVAAWSVGWEAGMFDLKVSELPEHAEEWSLECGTLLLILERWSRLLPHNVRMEMLDEWIDEIVTAELHGRSVHRRTGSILWRALPLMIWRSLRSGPVSEKCDRDD